MYDISFIISVSDINCSITNKHNENYSSRLDKFKKCGLVNILDKKVKLFLLVGNEDILNIKNDWNCDIEIIRSDFWHNSPKTYDFFANFKKEKINNSRWFMKVDDDSSTNVSKLVDKIDSDFSYQKCFNITGDESHLRLCRGAGRPQDDMFISLIDESPYSNFNERKMFRHEWEHNIISQSAMNRVLRDRDNIKILKKSLKYGNTGRSDHLFSVCSNLSGVPFIQVPYMTHNPRLNDFLNGKIFHIHYLYEEKRGGSWISFKLIKKYIEMKNF